MGLMNGTKPQQIDGTKAGVLRLDAAVLGALLGLPASCRIFGMQVTADAQTVDLHIEGAPMPTQLGRPPERVRLMQVTEKDETTGDLSRWWYFDHAPEVRLPNRDLSLGSSVRV